MKKFDDRHGSCSSGVVAGQECAGVGVGMGKATLIGSITKAALSHFRW